MKFNQTVGNKGGSIGEKDEKIDVTATTPEEKEQQDKVLNEITEINDFNQNIDDTSLDESEEEEKSEEDDSESEEDESEEESESEEEEEDSEEEESEESDEEDSQEEESEEEQPKEAEPETVDWDLPVNQKKIFDKLFKEQPTLLPEAARENYSKFFKTGNTTFLHLDNSLHKLIDSLDMISEAVPFPQRVEAAFKLAFSDKVKKMAQKKGEVIAEVRAQKVNKAATPPTKGDDSKSKKSRYTTEQLAAAKRIGVELPK